MSQVIRYDKIGGNGREIVVRFIDFVTVSEKTGLALSQKIFRQNIK